MKVKIPPLEQSKPEYGGDDFETDDKDISSSTAVVNETDSTQKKQISNNILETKSDENGDNDAELENDEGAASTSSPPESSNQGATIKVQGETNLDKKIDVSPPTFAVSETDDSKKENPANDTLHTKHDKNIYNGALLEKGETQAQHPCLPILPFTKLPQANFRRNRRWSRKLTLIVAPQEIQVLQSLGQNRYEEEVCSWQFP